MILLRNHIQWRNTAWLEAAKNHPLNLTLSLNPIIRWIFCKTRDYKTYDCNLYCNVDPVSSCDRAYGSCKETITLKAPVDIWAYFQGNTDDAFLHDLLARRNGVISITCHQLKKLLSYSPRTEFRIQCWFCRECVKLLLWGRREKGTRRLFLRVTRVVYLARKRFTLNTFPRQCR